MSVELEIKIKNIFENWKAIKILENEFNPEKYKILIERLSAITIFELSKNKTYESRLYNLSDGIYDFLNSFDIEIDLSICENISKIFIQMSEVENGK